MSGKLFLFFFKKNAHKEIIFRQSLKRSQSSHAEDIDLVFAKHGFCRPDRGCHRALGPSTAPSALPPLWGWGLRLRLAPFPLLLASGEKQPSFLTARKALGRCGRAASPGTLKGSSHQGGTWPQAPRLPPTHTPLRSNTNTPSRASGHRLRVLQC